MRNCLILLEAFFSLVSLASPDAERWKSHANNVTITRDDFGIAHVVGKSDADTVFGTLYAQAEDDFPRIENNYLNALGRLAKAEGEKAIWSDLRARLFMDEARLSKIYETSPAWLKKLMMAFADGLNYYLATHKHVKPRVLTRFEPWMALAFSEGSIGGDIESISLTALQAFYENNVATSRAQRPSEDLQGSNGIAIAPSRSKNGHSLLLINPHTSFYFRSELQMTSSEGLNCYGAATWGQFFIYQGFNEDLGFMHTSSTVDAIDEFLEDPQTDFEKEIVRIHVKGMPDRVFTIYRNHHGPVVRKENGKWVTVSLMQEPLKALTQSYLRMKAKDLKAFKKTLEMKADSTNNTVYADRDGNIAFFYATFVPRRSDKANYTKPVDGMKREFDWRGTLNLSELPSVVNPKNGWVYNTNNAPWSAAGPQTLKKSEFARYIDQGSENARGENVLALLKDSRKYDLDALQKIAFDNRLMWFEKYVPQLIAAWNGLAPEDPFKKTLQPQIESLRRWDFRWALQSTETTLAVFWAQELLKSDQTMPKSPAAMLESLDSAAKRLLADFGKWDISWGEVNRFQRLTGAIEQRFSDTNPSLAVPFTPGHFGSLAAYRAKSFEGSKRLYGVGGNSFLAIVEFGPKVRAKAILVGGESSDPKSKHFNDQSALYVNGQLRDVYFYPEQLRKHTERTYQPGILID